MNFHIFTCIQLNYYSFQKLFFHDQLSDLVQGVDVYFLEYFRKPFRVAQEPLLVLPYFRESSTDWNSAIGPLHDPVTWYGINYTGTQITQRDFQNKGKLAWTGASSFVLEVPLRNLRPSVIYSVPCDRIVQRAYSVPK